jgi:hypothetical protein
MEKPAWPTARIDAAIFDKKRKINKTKFPNTTIFAAMGMRFNAPKYLHKHQCSHGNTGRMHCIGFFCLFI